MGQPHSNHRERLVPQGEIREAGVPRGWGPFLPSSPLVGSLGGRPSPGPVQGRHFCSWCLEGAAIPEVLCVPWLGRLAPPGPEWGLRQVSGSRPSPLACSPASLAAWQTGCWSLGPQGVSPPPSLSSLPQEFEAGLPEASRSEPPRPGPHGHLPCLPPEEGLRPSQQMHFLTSVTPVNLIERKTYNVKSIDQ